MWRLRPGGSPELLCALPVSSLPNGLALDPRSGTLYVTDSAQGIVWSVPAVGGTATPWLTHSSLAPQGYMGANGIKVHNGAVWVSNSDQGTILRIPILGNGEAGDPELRASGMASIDDFAFPGAGDELFATVNHADQVDRVDPSRTPVTVLTGQDGLSNPTSIVFSNGLMYVMSAAYVTRQNPDIVTVPRWLVGL